MATVTEIADAIRDVGKRLSQQISAFGWSQTQPLSQTLGGMTISINPDTLAGYSNIVAGRVERLTKTQLDSDNFGVWLNTIIPQLSLLQFNMLNQGQPFQFNNALAILTMIDTAIPLIPPREPKVNWEDLKDQKSLLPRDIASRLRAIDTRLKDLDPRSREIVCENSGYRKRSCGCRSASR